MEQVRAQVPADTELGADRAQWDGEGQPQRWGNPEVTAAERLDFGRSTGFEFFHFQRKDLASAMQPENS